MGIILGWDLETILKLAKTYKEKAKENFPKQKEYNDKAVALETLVLLLRDIPDNRRKKVIGSLGLFFSAIKEELSSQETAGFFSLFNKKSVPLSRFVEQINLVRSYKEQLAAA
ncbi:MAG: hypothetical protein AABX82_06015 [Nanoarchaeota archaeon]